MTLLDGIKMALRNRSSAVQILALVREAVEPALLTGLAAVPNCSSQERAIINAIHALWGKGELDLKIMRSTEPL